MAKIKKLGLKRRKGFLLYIDKQGDIAEAKMKRGGTKGHRSCKAPKKAKPAKKRATKKRAAKRKGKKRGKR